MTEGDYSFQSSTVLIAFLVIIFTVLILFPPRRLETIAGRIYLRNVIIPRAGNLATSEIATNDIRTKQEDRRRTVDALFIYPVKSLRAVEVDSIQLDSKGFQNDRRLMLITPMPLPAWKTEFTKGEPTHRFVSQRQCPRLATVTAKIIHDQTNDEQTTIQFSSSLLPRETLTVVSKHATEPTEESRQVYLAKLWDDIVQVEHMGDESSTFFRKLMDADDLLLDELKNVPVRLVQQSNVDRRSTEDAFTPPSSRSLSACENPLVSLADGFPILIATQASLEELNRRIKAKKQSEIPMSRFRPNIVVQGSTMEPFEEDRWKVIAIDGVIFHIVKGCPRCKQSCTDQVNGTIDEEPLSTLREFRIMSPGKQPDAVFFAQNAIAAIGMKGKTIYKGAEVKVLQWGAPEWGDE